MLRYRTAKKHLSDSEMTRYRERTMEAEELVLANDHMLACPDCSRRSNGPDLKGVYSFVRSSLEMPPNDHLLFEQLEGYSDDTLGAREREEVERHLAACEECEAEIEGFFDKTKKDVEVILSDVPLDAKALSDQFARGELADQGKIHTFEIIINSEGKPISTMWRHSGFKGPTPSGLSTADIFTAKTFDGKLVDASYKSAKPGDFFDNTFAFDVSFRAAVTH